LKRKVNSIPRLLSGGIGTLMFSVVVTSLRWSVGCVGCMSRRGCLIRRPGSQPKVIDGRSKAALTSSCGARIEAKGLSGGIGTLMFSVVVASLRGSVGCVARWWSPFGRPGSQPIDGRAASIMSRPSAGRARASEDGGHAARVGRQQIRLPVTCSSRRPRTFSCCGTRAGFRRWGARCPRG